MNMPLSNYPGGSRSRVSKAGAAVRDGNATQEDISIIDTWREAHRPVLNTFQALLRMRTKDKDVVVAQRHKRKLTIFNKLQRFPSMNLARMDDIAGCRLIFNDARSLYEFRNGLHNARVNHKLKNNIDKYDYMKHPKSTGYRGIHDIYEYDVRSNNNHPSKGLCVEIQYRTAVQHAWATAVEVVGSITENQPKFQSGDIRYGAAMALASEILARSSEGMKSCHPNLTNTELVRQFSDLDSELGLVNLLRGLNATNNEPSEKKNFILMFSGRSVLDIKSFRDGTDALRDLFRLEKDNPGLDIVLVRADSINNVRVAFKNYFSDATDFIKLLEDGRKILSDG